MDKKNLYKLKWTSSNNPDGWIEPTTYCQLKCPGCYRGLAEENPLRQHEDLLKLKNEIDWFIKNRNIQTVSIAGGEPLLYPKIEELIDYISKKGLKTKIFTNGVALTKEKLVKLKSVGVTELVIHIDKYQRKAKSEELMNNLRTKYCEMFRSVGGINLGFIMPLSKDNLSDLDVLSDFFKKNSDIVNLVVFTVYKEMLPNKKTSEELEITSHNVFDSVKKSFGINYCAYLGKELSEDISWLFALSAYSKGQYLGSFDGKFYETLQKRYYKKKGKFFITINNRPTKTSHLVRYMLNSSVRKILKSALSKKANEINTQVVLIIDAPDKEKEGWNLCDGCPDAMIHNGVLVPSCLLERIKRGENIHIK